MSYRGVATMAFMLALSAIIGVETFMMLALETPPIKWLTQLRLATGAFISIRPTTRLLMSNWLSEQPEVDSVWWRWEKMSLLLRSIQVVSTGPSEGELEALTIKLGIQANGIIYVTLGMVDQPDDLSQVGYSSRRLYRSARQSWLWLASCRRLL
ncbi:hypothetical protein O9993_16425 [Vibrio lentus]|nr:hypothetical protein [Vibrio lentus]